MSYPTLREGIVRAKQAAADADLFRPPAPAPVPAPAAAHLRAPIFFDVAYRWPSSPDLHWLEVEAVYLWAAVSRSYAILAVEGPLECQADLISCTVRQ